MEGVLVRSVAASVSVFDPADEDLNTADVGVGSAEGKLFVILGETVRYRDDCRINIPDVVVNVDCEFFRTGVFIVALVAGRFSVPDSDAADRVAVEIGCQFRCVVAHLAVPDHPEERRCRSHRV